jgi:hypothetical protein
MHKMRDTYVDLEFHPLTDLRVLEILAVTLFLCPLASSAHSFWHWQMEGKPGKAERLRPGSAEHGANLAEHRKADSTQPLRH